MENETIKKAVHYAISHLTNEIELLDESLETKEYSPLQRGILEEKLGRLKNDLQEFRSITI